MRNLSRGMILLLLLLVALPTFASSHSNEINSDQPPIIAQESDSAIVRVIPNEARVGSQHVILVTGLNANESITVTITEDATGNSVYSTTTTADERGITEVEIFTETTDTAGMYTVDIANGSGVVIASETLSILAADTFTPEITITPLSGEAGTVFTIEIVGAEPFLLMDVEIENNNREELFEQEVRTNVDGDVALEFVSDRESIGTLMLTIVADEEIIFEQELEVLAQQLQGTVVIEPDAALPGETVFITVSGATPDTALRIDILLDDEIIETLDAASNISGLAIIAYDFASDVTRGDYRIEVYEVNTLIAEQALLVDMLPVTTTVSPTVGTVGTIFLVSVSDLRPDEEITIELVRDDEGVQNRTVIADAEGVGRAAMGQRVDLTLGTYTINVVRLGEVISTSTVEVAEERPPTPQVINPDDISLTIDPLSGTIPTVYTITVEGLPAEQNITLFVLRNGESVFSTGATSDEDGIYTTELTSEPTDPPGTYTIEIRAEGEVIASGEFEIADETASGEDNIPDEQDTDTTQPEIDSDVILDIQPSVLRQGERVEFIIRELTPDEIVLFELIFQDEVIYRAEPMADANGIATVALVAREDESLGEYNVRILRDGELIAADGFTIVTVDATIDNAQVIVEPETGAQGTEYTITISGLTADETVTVTVNLDDAVVFEDERTANANGFITLTLNSDVTDALGTYDVTITRADNDPLTDTLEITEGSDVATQPNTDDAPIITIAPRAGEIGTNHVVTVTGLEANEAFTLSIEFEGEIVYTVERTADENGSFETTIAAADDDGAGDYTVIIDRADADDVTSILTVVGDGEEVADNTFNLEIVPTEVADGTPFDVIISGLDAEELVTIQVEYDGEILFETDRAADAEGRFVLNLVTDPGDPLGTYTIIVTRGDEVLSEDVEIVAAIAEGDEQDETDTPDEQDEPTDETDIPDLEQEVMVSVDPTEGDIGTAYEFIISGLNSNEAFDVVVEYNGESVFESTRTSDASGFATITLETSEDDPAGAYTFNVVRNGETLTSVTFEVLGTVADAEEADNTEDDTSPTTEDDTSTPVAPEVYADGTQVEFGAASTLRVVEFDGFAGDVVTITVNSGGEFDTVATLFAPDGNEIATDDDGGLGVDPEIERIVLPATGTYTLEIRPFSAGDTGSATVTINRDTVQSLDNAREVMLDSKTTSNILTVAGEAGETLTLVVSLVEGEVSQLVITAEQGDAQLMSYQAVGLPQTLRLGFVVPDSGIVVIRIGSDGTTTATLNAQIER